MKKHHPSLTVVYCMTVFALSHTNTFAQDLYVDLSNDDTITISSDVTEHVDIVIEDSASSHRTSVNQKTRQLPFHQAVVSAAKQTDLDPALIHAVIHVESRHNPKAVSPKGAVGLMQLMPATAARFNATNKTDYQQNILAGSRYLSELLTLFNEDLSLALAAYNAGPNAVKKYNNRIPPYAETAQYVPKVLKYYAQYSR